MNGHRAEVHVHIEELLVEGFAAEDGDAMREAVRREVARRLAETPAGTAAASAAADAVRAASTGRAP